MPYPLPLTRTEAYLAYKAGVIQQSDLKPSLAIPRNGIDAWLAYWTGLTNTYPVKNVGKNLFNKNTDVLNGNYYLPGNASSTRIVTAISSTMTRTLLIRLQEGQTYTIQKKASARFRFGFTTTNNPAPDTDGVITSRLARADTSSSVTFTVPNGSPYFVCNFFSDDQAADAQNGYDTIVNSVQIEEGSTATAYEPYTGEPLILQEEEAYIAYLSGVINEYPEKCLRRVGAYLRYLISARWGRPDHPLNREELYLSLLKTQVIPSGDPSSDIEIDGTAKAAFVDVKMYGDTTQDSYTGKNLLEIRPSDNSRGLTVVPNARTGEITFSGTTTAGYPWLNESFTDLPAGTYTFSIDKPVSKTLYLRLYNEDGAYPVTLQFTAGNTSDTKTTDYAIKRTVMLYGEASSGATVAEQTIKPMLEAGSTATSYEPYVGGVPAPNPDYPQQIQTVTGEQTVTVVGKNLVGATEQRYTNQGITTTMNSDGTITCKGTCAQAYFGITKQTSGGGIAEATPCNIPAGTYTLSLTNATDQFGVTLRLYASTTATDYKQVVVTKGNSSNTVTLTSPAVMFYIWGSSTTVGQEIDETIGIQFEPGSAATPFAPYSKQTYPINLGKNLFDKEHYNMANLYIDSGGVLRTGTPEIVYIPCQPNTTYAVSKTNAGSNPRFAVFDTAVAPAAGNSVLHYVGTRDGQDAATSYTITTSNNARYLGVFYRTNATEKTTEQILATLQIEAGSHKTPYAPYFEPIELCKLGTYQDYIWKDGDDWKVHKATSGNMTLNGSEDGWSKGNNGRFNLSGYAPSPVSGSIDNNPILSNRFISRFSFDDLSVFLSGTNELVCFIYTSASTLTAWKAWLSSNNTTVCYALATPTDTTITDTALIAQLEALVNGGAENGTTYIKVNATDPNLPGLLYVEAPKYD